MKKSCNNNNNLTFWTASNKQWAMFLEEADTMCAAL